jgi:glycosyltransferase involved in cell wall biosynthesis
VYPPVGDGKFDGEKKYAPLEKGVGYFLAAGRLLHYKKFDLLVQAFGELGLPLKIVGEGPEEGNIKYQISTSRNIELLPFVSDDTLRKLYSGAKAVLFPQAEDFGLVAAEAQACGAPVIAYDGGGAREIVRDGETGIFFQEQTPRSIIGAVNRFLAMRLNRLQISKKSRSFSRERFQRGIMGQIPPNILDQ